MYDQIFISSQAEDPVSTLGVEGLAQFNHAEVGDAGKTALIAKPVGGDGQPLAAGLVGYTVWGWLFVEKLWVGEPLRSRGLAAKLLAAAEGEAVSRGCNRAWLDTFNPNAKRLYERLGYEVFGELPEFVGSNTRFFMKKQLVT